MPACVVAQDHKGCAPVFQCAELQLRLILHSARSQIRLLHQSGTLINLSHRSGTLINLLHQSGTLINLSRRSGTLGTPQIRVMIRITVLNVPRSSEPLHALLLSDPSSQY
jgi:hypothetical protein